MLKKFLFVFFISMVPLIELRGAIPYAIGFGLPLFPSYIVAIIGNMIPVPFIFFFAHRLLLWGKDLKIKPFDYSSPDAVSTPAWKEPIILRKSGSNTAAVRRYDIPHRSRDTLPPAPPSALPPPLRLHPRRSRP